MIITHGYKKKHQETDFAIYLNNKLTPMSIYYSINKIKPN